MVDELPGPRRVGPPAAEERVPRRRAERLLDVGPREAQGLAGEAAQVRRDDVVAAVAGQLRTQVVADDDEHVALPDVGGPCEGQQQGQDWAPHAFCHWKCNP